MTVTVSLSKNYTDESARLRRELHTADVPHIELNFAINLADHAEYETCEGHESLRDDSMGASVYCDGSCRPAWTPLIRMN